MKRILALAVLLLMTACAGNTSNSHTAQQITNGKLMPAQGQGVVVVAMTLQSLDRDTSDATLFLQGASGMNYMYARIMTDMINAPGSDASPAGRVYMLSVPAGDYLLRNVSGNWSRRTGSVGFDDSQYYNVPLNQKVTVRAGEVTYLGSVNVNINFQASVSYSNEFKRDMYDLQHRYQLTDVSNIKQAVLSSAK
jgi:ABC-type Fe3+-hydroxamate transport system substrate-binding protein